MGYYTVYRLAKPLDRRHGKFSAQFVTNYTNDNNNLPPTDFTGLITLAPDAPSIHDSKGNLNWQVVDGTATFYNPLSPLVQKASANTNNLISNLSLRYQLLTGLEIKGAFGYNHDMLNQLL